MSKILTNITRKVGDYIASKTKDADNELFTEISETVINEFINEIKKDNPVLASWVEDWKKKKMGKPTKTTISYDRDSDGRCGWTPRYKSTGGCGSSSISYDGGC